MDPHLLLPLGFDRMAHRAIEHANELVDPWAVLTAGGLTPDLESLDFGYYAERPRISHSRDLTPCLSPYPQLQILDLHLLQDVIGGLDTVPPTNRADILIVWAAYCKGLPSYISPFLRFGRLTCPPQTHLDLTGTLPIFPSSRLGDPATPESLSALRVTGSNDTATLALLGDAAHTQALAAAVDDIGLTSVVKNAVRSARNDACVSVLIRTAFTRPALLRRALTSLSVATSQGPLHETVLTSDCADSLAHVFDELKRDYPGIGLQLHLTPPGRLPSRTATLIAGIQRASGDYVWFVDDDDMAAPSALEAIQTAVYSRHHPILIGHSSVYTETWTQEASGRDVLQSSRLLRVYSAGKWPNVYGGTNPLPLCGVVYPRELALRTLTANTFRNDLSEDYALLLSVLGDPQAEVRLLPAELAHISRRRAPHADNPMALVDREPWAADIASFIADIFNPDALYSCFLVQLGCQLADTAHDLDRLHSDSARALEATQRKTRGLEHRIQLMQNAFAVPQALLRLLEERQRPLQPPSTPPAQRRATVSKRWPRLRSLLHRFLPLSLRRLVRRALRQWRTAGS
jgi:hypothetical protein